MNNKYKEYIYILYISLLPVTATLLSLKLNNVGYFNSKPYYYIISLFLIVLLFSFVLSCFITLEDIVKKEEFSTIKNFKLACLLLFGLLYIPLHYLFNYHKKLCFISFIILFIDLLSLVYFYNSFDKYVVRIDTEYYKKEIRIVDNFDYLFYDDKYTMTINKDYKCPGKMGDYVLTCEDSNTDSFIGVYSYNIDNYSNKELDDIYTYHLNQTIGYIEEANYQYEISNINNIDIITYNNMTIYISYKDYDLDNDTKVDNRLIIIYETSENDINNYYKVLKGIKVNK